MAHQHLDNVLATGQQHSTELKVTANGGAYIHLESCRTADPGGTEYQCRTVMTDITARKKAEETALEKDRHLRSLAEALPVLISYLDSDLQFQFSNGAHRHWLGLTPDELIGRAIGEVLGDNFDPACIDYFNDALEGRTVTFECDFRHPDRGLRQIQVMLVPDLQRGHKVNGIHTLCIDITERKIVEEQNARSRVLAVMLERLSADERSVYKMLIRGEANKLIAQELDCGVRTVERRRQSILKKLEVESVAELLHKLADIRGVTD